MSKSISEISSILDSLNAGLEVFRRPESYVDDERRWSCNITISRDDTMLKVRAEGSNFNEVLGIAFDKLEPLIAAPAVANALVLPLLAAPE